jgi:hypothetical protein
MVFQTMPTDAPTGTGFKPFRSLRSVLSREQLSVAIERERARADRKGTALTLVLFELPERGRNRSAGRRLMRTLIRRMRVTDDIGWYDRRHVGVLLSDTPVIGAWQFVRHVLEKLSSRGTEVKCRLYAYPDLALSCGGASAGVVVALPEAPGVPPAVVTEERIMPPRRVSQLATG